MTEVLQEVTGEKLVPQFILGKQEMTMRRRILQIYSVKLWNFSVGK